MMKLPSGEADALVMGAVHKKRRSVQSGKPGTGYRGGAVYLILSGILMERTGGQILNDGASEPDVDKLHTLAYAKDWLPCPDKGGKQSKLPQIQGPLYDPGAVPGLPEQGRVRIIASGQNEKIAGGGQARIQRDHRCHAKAAQGQAIVSGPLPESAHSGGQGPPHQNRRRTALS